MHAHLLVKCKKKRFAVGTSPRSTKLAGLLSNAFKTRLPRQERIVNAFRVRPNPSSPCGYRRNPMPHPPRTRTRPVSLFLTPGVQGVHFPSAEEHFEDKAADLLLFVCVQDIFGGFLSRMDVHARGSIVVLAFPGPRGPARAFSNLDCEWRGEETAHCFLRLFFAD